MEYKPITQAEAKHLMDTEPNVIVLDVRNPEEYSNGHIKGAVNLPNPSITNREIPELPDKDQKILVYCLSGQRSRIAAKKLAILGYTNIHEFGGIADWKYETEL